MGCEHECKHCGSRVAMTLDEQRQLLEKLTTAATKTKQISQDVAEGTGCLLWFIGLAILALACGWAVQGFPGLK